MESSQTLLMTVVSKRAGDIVAVVGESPVEVRKVIETWLNLRGTVPFSPRDRTAEPPGNPHREHQASSAEPPDNSFCACKLADGQVVKPHSKL